MGGVYVGGGVTPLRSPQAGRCFPGSQVIGCVLSLSEAQPCLGADPRLAHTASPGRSPLGEKSMAGTPYTWGLGWCADGPGHTGLL